MRVKEQKKLDAAHQTPIGYMLSPIRAGVVKDLRRNIFKYLIVLPVVVWMILFCYKPMYGVIIAFQDFRPRLGIEGSEWVGISNFIRFFEDPWFARTFRNTLTIGLLSLVFSFPVPIGHSDGPVVAFNCRTCPRIISVHWTKLVSL